MKKYLLIGSIIGVLVGAVLFGADIAKALNQYVTVFRSQSATTTPAYIAEGAASSTWVFDNAVSLRGPRSLFVQLTASSSANSAFRCFFEFSNDIGDNKNWFMEDTDELNGVYAFGNNIRHSTSTPIYHTWGAATSTTQTDVIGRAINVPYIKSNFGRITCDMEPNGNSIANTSDGYLTTGTSYNGAIYIESAVLEDL